MNKKDMVKRYVFLLLTAVVLYGMYIGIMIFGGQPLYVLLLAYAAVIIVYYWFNRASVWAVRGNYLYVMGQKVRAKLILQKAIDANTKSPSAYIYLALMAVQDDRDSETAFALLEKAKVRANSVIDERNIITTLASCHWLASDTQKAIDVLEEMRTTHEYTNAGVLTTLGYLYFVQENFDKSIELSKLAMEDEPDHGAAWDNIGQVQYKQGDMEAAKESFHTALSKRENLADAAYFLALIYEGEGDKDNAKEYFRRAAISTIGIYNTVTAEQVEKKFQEYHG
ncbi:MAG: tetratricopeptide repeat protein [Defluviitaleaceae bacterium]|nr:tetratricopeptide repeat protein [Defluviitaleaceae bacterium]